MTTATKPVSATRIETIKSIIFGRPAATFVLTSRKTGKQFTFCVSGHTTRFFSAATDGAVRFELCGFVRAEFPANYRRVGKSRVAANATVHDVLSWFLKNIDAGTLPTSVSFELVEGVA